MYKYALDSNNNIIDILNLTKERGQLGSHYSCISCNTQLIPKLGEKVIKHFAHKNLQSCSNETYLHKLGKQILYNTYIKCLKEGVPFYVEYNVEHICTTHTKTFPELNCSEEKPELFDLTKVFNLIKIEGSHLSFTADILLESSYQPEKKLMLEVAVTHTCSDDKINSGIPIIELKLDSEASVQWLHKSNISEILKKISVNIITLKRYRKNTRAALIDVALTKNNSHS